MILSLTLITPKAIPDITVFPLIPRTCVTPRSLSRCNLRVQDHGGASPQPSWISTVVVASIIMVMRIIRFPIPAFFSCLCPAYIASVG